MGVRTGLIRSLAVVVVLSAAVQVHASGSSPRAMLGTHLAQPSGLLGRLEGMPVAFEANRGQLDSRVRFTARAGDSTLYLTQTEAVIATLQGRRLSGGLGASQPSMQLARAILTHHRLPPVTETVVRLRPLGASAHPLIAGGQRLPGVINDYIGNVPRHWHTGIPTFSRVTEHAVYPGIDLVYYGTGSRLEYDWVLAPGASAGRIRLAVTGPGGLTLDRHGAIQLAGGGMRLTMAQPHIYQVAGGRRTTIPGGYVLTGAHTVAFRLGRYDRHRTLIIDPGIATTGTYLGGSGDETVYGVRIDSQGNTIVLGDTTSATFPAGSQTSFQSPALGDQNMYIACLSPDLNTFFWITRIGGKTSTVNGLPAQTFGNSLDLGADDAIYAGGTTAVSDIPRLSPFQTAPFVLTGYLAKLSAGGQLLLASTVGGATGVELSLVLALNRSTGDLFVGLTTTSGDLPTQAGVVQTTYARQQCPVGQGSATIPCFAGYLMRITGLAAAAFSAHVPHTAAPVEANGTYISAMTAGNTFIHVVAVGPNNTVDITGTGEADLPVSPGAPQPGGTASAQTAYVGVFTATFVKSSYYLSFGNPGQPNTNGNTLTVDGSDLVVGVNAFAAAANNHTQITAYLELWPLGSSGMPSGTPSFSRLQSVEGLDASLFTTYIADTRFVQGWNTQSDPFGENGMPIELSQNSIATAGGVVVAFEGVLVVRNHALGAPASGTGATSLNGSGKDDDAGPIDSVSSAAGGWTTRLGLVVHGPLGGVQSAVAAPAVEARALHPDARAGAAQSAYAGGADVYILGINRTAPPAPTPTPTATPKPTPKPAKKCPKNATVKKGKCACKKGFVMKKGKCVKKK